MHIPDAYLSPATEAVAFGVMIPVWMVATRKSAAHISSRKVPMLAIGSAFCFAIQMFNIPAFGGTTAHALGAVLLAILVGPWAAILGMSLTLAIQALLFGDGGILSFGANCFDMALVAPMVGYGIYRLLCGRDLSNIRRITLAGAVGAFFGTAAASLAAGVILGLQPLVAHDLSGRALYCPFGLDISVPAMVGTHLIVVGPAEAILTVGCLAYLFRTFPEHFESQSRVRVGTQLRLIRMLGWFLALTPLGLIASGSAWGEWELAEIKKMVGYEPKGLAQSHPVFHPILPDYGFHGMTAGWWLVVGYLVSALLGCGVVGLFAYGLFRHAKSDSVRSVQLHSCKSDIPDWLTIPNPPIHESHRVKAPWFERTLLRIQASLEKTSDSDATARAPGFLQTIQPAPKMLVILMLLITVGMSQSNWVLSGIAVGVVGLALTSRIPMGAMIVRVGSAVIFFGLIVAIPVSLREGTFRVSGLVASAMILLRLADGIALALLWRQTTRWNALLNSLKQCGLSATMVTTANLSYRYLFVVFEMLAEMVQARTSRQVGACSAQEARRYMGNGTAVLFAKSVAFTEEMHWAMTSRTLPTSRHMADPGRWTARDGLAVLTSLTILILTVFHGSLHAF